MENWPIQLIPKTLTWHLKFNTKAFESPFNQSVSTHAFPGGQWVGDMSFNNMNRAKTAELKAFIYSLKGANGRFLMGDPAYPGFIPAGVPVVSQSGQQGGLLQTTGWHASTLVLRAGDYFSVGNELKMVTSDAWSDSSGLATLHFAPWLRKSPSVGDSIETDSPVGMFRLSDDSQGSFSFRPKFADLNLSIVEAFYV